MFFPCTFHVLLRPIPFYASRYFRPFCFINVDGQERRQVSRSVSNATEAQIACRLIEFLCRAFPFVNVRIGVYLVFNWGVMKYNYCLFGVIFDMFFHVCCTFDMFFSYLNDTLFMSFFISKFALFMSFCHIFISKCALFMSFIPSFRI